MSTSPSPTFARLLLTAAAFVVVVAGMRAASSIIVPFLLALFIAVITTPYYFGLRNKGVPTGWALSILILALLVLGLAGGAFTRKTVKSVSKNLPTYQEQLDVQFAAMLEWLETKNIEIPDQEINATFELSSQRGMALLGSALSAVSSVLTNTMLIMICAIFMLLEAALLPERLKSISSVPDGSLARVNTILDNVRRYIGMKTAISALTGLLIFVLAWVLGIDYPLLLGLTGFLLNFIPAIGSVLAGVPGVLLAFIEFGPDRAIIAAVGYLVINATVSNVIEPRFVGKGLGLSPIVIIMCLVFWGWVFGPVGMLLSVPLTMAVKIVMESADETRWMAALMGPLTTESLLGGESGE